MTIDLSYFDRWIIAPYAICLFGSVLIGLAYIAVRLKHSGIKTEYTMYIHSAVREFPCLGDAAKNSARGRIYQPWRSSRNAFWGLVKQCDL